MRVHIPDSRHVFYKEEYGQDTFVGAGNRRIGSLVLKLLDDREPLKTQVFARRPLAPLPISKPGPVLLDGFPKHSGRFVPALYDNRRIRIIKVCKSLLYKRIQFFARSLITV